MQKKCKFCFSKLSENDTVCSFCKIDCSKDKNALTKEEKKIYSSCLALRNIAHINIFLGGSVALLLLTASFKIQEPAKKIFMLGYVAIICVLIYFGFALKKYKSWCYYAAFFIYGLMILLSLIRQNISEIILPALFLFYIVNPTSKSILLRKI